MMKGLNCECKTPHQGASAEIDTVGEVVKLSELWCVCFSYTVTVTDSFLCILFAFLIIFTHISRSLCYTWCFCLFMFNLSHTVHPHSAPWLLLPLRGAEMDSSLTASRSTATDSLL